MTAALRRAAWDQAHRELCAERGALLSKFYLALPVPAAVKALKRHLERELDWYEMKLMGPDLDRLEARAKEREDLARDMTALVKRIERAEEAQAQAGRRVSR